MNFQVCPPSQAHNLGHIFLLKPPGQVYLKTVHLGLILGGQEFPPNLTLFSEYAYYHQLQPEQSHIEFLISRVQKITIHFRILHLRRHVNLVSLAATLCLSLNAFTALRERVGEHLVGVEGCAEYKQVFFEHLPHKYIMLKGS